MAAHLVEPGMGKSILGSDALIVVKTKHLVEQVKGVNILNDAYLRPWYALLLHFIGNHAAVAVFKSDFLDCVRAEQADHGN